MATPKKIQYKDYADYLKSPKWKQIKKEFKDESIFEHECFFCVSGESLQHHHWQYPKDWNDDHYSNLILLCKYHHELTHELIFKEYKAKSFIHYISCLSSLMIGDAHCRGFQEGIAKGEDRSIDVANEFISSSNTDIDKINKLRKERGHCLSVLDDILNMDNLKYNYKTECVKLKTHSVSSDLAFVDLICPDMDITVFSESFNQVLNLLGRG